MMAFVSRSLRAASFALQVAYTLAARCFAKPPAESNLATVTHDGGTVYTIHMNLNGQAHVVRLKIRRTLILSAVNDRTGEDVTNDIERFLFDHAVVKWTPELCGFSDTFTLTDVLGNARTVKPADTFLL